MTISKLYIFQKCQNFISIVSKLPMSNLFVDICQTVRNVKFQNGQIPVSAYENKIYLVLNHVYQDKTSK